MNFNDLTPAQKLSLKTFITTDPFTSAQAPGNDGSAIISIYLNGVFSPDFWVWRKDLSKDEVLNGTSPDGTTFIFANNGFISRSVQELLVFAEMFGTSGTVDASRQRVRDAFVDIFSGAGNAASNRAHLSAQARRKATRVEKVLAVGAGTTASVATMAHEGPISGDDVQAIRES